MSNEVYANGMEVACKSAAGKTVAALPDVCLSPPTPPAGPVPIPYPNTAYASDTSDGSKTVQISGKEVMLKDKSNFKTSTGNEAATKTLGMGVVTHTIQGKANFASWSMNVKFEGENAVRHLDLTLHNEMSVPSNTPTWPYIDDAAIALDHPCVGDMKKEAAACKEYTPHGRKDVCKQRKLPRQKPSGKMDSDEADTLADKTAADDCLAARRCSLQQYSPNKCCAPQTPHHLIEASALHDTGRGGKESTPLKGISNYSENKAPCICAEGINQNTGTHGLMHTFQSASAASARTGEIELSTGDFITDKKTTYGTAKKKATEAVEKTFPQTKCDPACLEEQMDNYHKQCGMNDRTTIKAVETGQTDISAAEKAVAERTDRIVQSRAPGVGGRR